VPTEANATASFLKAIAPWEQVYRNLSIAYFAIKGRDRQQAISAQISLRSADPDDYGFGVGRFETEHFIFERFTFAVSQGQLQASLTKALSAGEIPGRPETSLVSSNGAFRSNFYPYHLPGQPMGSRQPAVVMRGNDRSSFLNPLGDRADFDWALKAASPPYATLDDVMDAFGLARLQNIDEWTQLVVVAETPAIIDFASSKFEDGEINVCCLTSSALDRSRLSLGLKYFSQSKGEGFPSVIRTHTNAAHWDVVRQSELRERITAKIPAGGARIAHVFLSYDGIALHEAFVQDLAKSVNLRRALHLALDKDGLIVEELLLKTGQSFQENFDHGVALLLNMLGFATALHGQAWKLKDQSVDVVALTPSGDVLLVECTTGLPNHNNKVSNLVRRLAEVRDLLERQGTGARILPVLATALPKAQAQNDIELLRRSGVALLAREDLAEALNRTQFHADPQAFYDQLSRSVEAGVLRPGNDA
jgi:hypothetical protein